ncbi:MAG: DUF1223 domain-containing protein [Micropepsaceae bacterium]
MNRILAFGLAVLTAANLWTISATAAGGLVVVELFQSQGCSSCPPANANVNAMTARSDLLVLSFGVTYWDRLGWRDTFATPAFTNRQYDYAKGLQSGNVYTPQVVLNGRQHLPGISRSELHAAIANAGRVPAGPLSVAANVVSVAAAPPQAPSEVWLVRYDPRTIEVAVQAGENDGRTLPHKNLVRELVRLGEWTGRARTFVLPPPGSAALRTAILMQQGRGGPILAALAH